MTDNPQQPNDPVQAPAEPVMSERDKFISMLPEELRTEGVFANHQNVGDLAKSYVSAAKMVGLDKNVILPIPRDDSPEAWDAVYNKLGRPDTPDKYNLSAYEAQVGDKEALKDYVEAAHKAGLNQKQIDAVFGKFFSDTSAMQKAQEEQTKSQFEEWSAELKKEYGMAFDQKLTNAVTMLERVGGDPLVKFVEENPVLAKNPVMVKFLVAMAEKTGEGDVLLASGQKTSGALSPADAQQQLAALSQDPVYSKAIMDKAHPQHDYYVQQRSKLFGFAYPDSQ